MKSLLSLKISQLQESWIKKLGNFLQNKSFVPPVEDVVAAGVMARCSGCEDVVVDDDDDDDVGGGG